MTQASLPAAGLLQLLWLASPALPVGGFSYSEGLEAAVELADVATESRASDWLADQLQLTLARGELPVIAQAIAAWRMPLAHQAAGFEQLQALNDWVLQTRETSEFRLQTEQMGRSLLDWLRNHEGSDPAQIEHCAQMPPSYPLAYALAAAQTQADVRSCLLAYAFGWAENMVQAALKSIPLGQLAGQRVLARLARDILSVVEQALHTGDDDRQAFTPMLAIRSAQHETQYSRLFRS
ncbi:MAG: urease accessory protein UreF [Burkholderiaceae bacterium]